MEKDKVTDHSPATVKGFAIQITEEPLDTFEKQTTLERISRQAQYECKPGPDAVHSADFLYDGEGLPA